MVGYMPSVLIGLESMGTEYYKFHLETNVHLWAWVPDYDPGICIGCPNAVRLGNKVGSSQLKKFMAERLKELGS